MANARVRDGLGAKNMPILRVTAAGAASGFGGLDMMLGILVAAVGVVLAAGAWAVHIQATKKAAASESWPIAHGTITANEIEHRREKSSNQNIHHDAYYIRVTYAYQALGQELTGGKIAFGFNNRFTSRHLAEQRLAPYGVGAQVQVRYNPDKPAEAVLETKHPHVIMPIVFTFAGVVAVIVGGFFIYLNP